MATSLASQLQKLATPQTDILNEKNKKFSLLFDSSEAANYGRDVYYDIGLSGFQELLKIDDSFEEFKDSIFGKHSKDFQRVVMDKVTNEKLDDELEKFLLLVSPYLEKQAAIKALEWLVHRYLVSVMNKRAFLMCFFPYYESPLFIRALQIIDVQRETDEWHWLDNTKKSGRPLGKKTVFSRWCHNQDFRAFISKYIKKVLLVQKKATNLKISISFYISTIAGGLCILPVIEEHHLMHIVNMWQKCLLSEHEELVAGMYLILSVLTVKANLSSSLLKDLLRTLAKTNPSGSLRKPYTMCLLTLCQHQDIQSLDVETVGLLEKKKKDFLRNCIRFMAKKKSVAPFLSAYTRGFIRRLVEESNNTAEEKKSKFDGYVEYIQEVPLSVSDGTKVLRSFLEVWKENFKLLQGMKTSLDMAAALNALEVSHPDGYSFALADFTAAYSGAVSKKNEAKEIVDAILHSGKTSASTSVKFIHVVHPDDNIRLAAVESFANRVSQGLDTDRKLIKLNLQYMLADDCPTVVEKGLSIKQITGMGYTNFVIDECKKLLKKSELRGEKWNSVKRLSATLLLENLSESYGGTQNKDMFYVFLPYIFCPKSDLDLEIAKLVLNESSSLKIPLLKAIASKINVYWAEEVQSRDNYATLLYESMPKIMATLSASDKSLWKIVGSQLEQDCSVNQYLSLVLLYFGLMDKGMDKKQRLEMAHLVLDFSLKRIDSTKSISKGNFNQRKVIASLAFEKSKDLSKGYITVQFLAACVLQTLDIFVLPEEFTTSKYWLPSMEGVKEGNLLILLKATRLALEIEQKGEGGVTIRNIIMATIFKDCLGTVERQYYFLAMIWGWHSSLPLSNTVDKALVVWCLNLGSALMDAYSSNLVWMLNNCEPLIPSLISALTSSTMEVRKVALQCIEKLAAIKGGRLIQSTHSMLLEKILQHSTEILSDESQLCMCLYEFNEAQPSQCSQVLQSLTDVILGDSSVHIKMGLLYAISCVSDLGVLCKLLSLAEKIMTQANACEGDAKIDVATSYTFYYILLHFSPKTSGVLEEEIGWNTFVQAVTCSKDVLDLKDKVASPQKLLMEQVMTQKFFTSIKKEELQAGLWSHLISCVVESEDVQVASRLKKGLRKTGLDAGLIVKEIEGLKLTSKVQSMREAQNKRKKMKSQPVDLQNWKKLGLMLETISVMASLGRPWLLTSALCHCLQETMTMDSVITDLVQQQILSALLHLLQESRKELGNEVSKKVTLNVEMIVQCIRSSVNHDTHRRAMLILAVAADIFPEVVLHNMMSIFTFMGTSMLRRDDSYSFQVIHQTIQSIVPVLIKCDSGSASELTIKLARVCQVFVDALPDLPEHRRLPLFIQLAQTIDIDKHFWILLALIADSYVMRGSMVEVQGSKDDRRSVPHIIDFALTLTNEFTVIQQVNVCCKLMAYICKLPEDIDVSLMKQKSSQKSKSKSDVICWETHSSKQYVNFKYTSTGLMAHLLSSEKFVAKVIEGRDEFQEELRDTYQLLLEKTMSYLHNVSESCERNKDKPSGKQWLALQRKVIDVLEGIISVLPPSLLLKVVEGLLKSPIALVRCRATELLCSKLQPSSSFFSKEDLLDLLPFIDILRKVGADVGDSVENRQVGLYALQLLIKHLAPHVKIGAIEPVMSTAVQLVCCKGTPMKVVTQALLVIAEAVGSLKAHAVGHLKNLMPVITKLLVSSDTDSEHLPLAAATATHKIVENMAEFLSPHLELLISAICRLCAMKEEACVQESRIGLRLAATRDSLPQRIEPRLIIPSLAEAYKTLSKNDLPALKALMMMVETLITKRESKVVIEQKPAFIDLFTQAMDLRTVKGHHESVDSVEDVVCSALVKLMLRLNEHDNVAIFAKLQFWASDAVETKPSRLITFYRFANHLAGTLKVLFIKAKLADNMYSSAASVLERNNSLNNADTVFGTGDEANGKATVLLKYILDTLMKIYLHDSVRFTNQERFQMMVQPLVNQLENTQIGKKAYKDLITNHFIPCVLKFTSAVADDSLWKDLNRAVLLRLRNDDEPIVILAALETFEALIDAFGEDYLQPLLADIMPYITEVFEMPDPEIEAATKEIYNKMESILGDSFRSYLDR